jgi:hypothetical protein
MLLSSMTKSTCIKTTTILTLIALITCCRSYEPSVFNTVVNTDGKKFSVAGTKILDQDGKEFLIKGVNVNGPGWAFSRDTLQDVDLIVDVWQFNTVRVCAAIGWEWSAKHNTDLDAIIRAFTEKNIVSILEVHDYTGIYPPEKGYRAERVRYVHPLSTFKKWWVDKANRYKNNSYVWFNIMNEPGSERTKESAELWSQIHGEVIDAIRGTGADNIIVLDDHVWGQANGYYGGASSYNSAIIRMGPELNQKFDNIVYSLHVYDSWRDGLSRFDQFFKDAHERELCVIVGEFGVGRENAPLYSSAKSMYDSAIPNNIGRIYWAWDDGSLPLTVDSYGWQGFGWQIDKTDGEKPGNLTWVGELVWLDNRGLLEAPLPDYNLDLPPFTNVDFEKVPPTGWSDWGGSSVQEGVSYNGTKALVVKSGASGGGGCTVELKPNTVYQFSAWGKNSSRNNLSSDVGIKYQIDPNDLYEQYHAVSFTGSIWEQKSVTFTTPEVLYGPTFFVWKNAANVTFYLDDVELVELGMRNEE